MQIEPDCFGYDAVDKLTQDLPNPAMISIRGASGSGKTVVGERLLEATIAAGQTARVLLLDDTGRDYLNQATGVWIDLLSPIPDGQLTLDAVAPSDIYAICRSPVVCPNVDVLVVDSLEELEDISPREIEESLAWLGAENDTSIICISESDLGNERTYADLTIDMEQLSGDEEVWQADSVFTIRRTKTEDQCRRAFQIDGYDIRMWELE